MTKCVSSSSPAPANSRQTRPTVAPLRIGYLDGVRGLASLYILITHLHQFAIQFVEPAGDINAHSRLRTIARFLNFTAFDYAHYAVGMFLVLSGYCLMLPVAASGDGIPRGGSLGFLRRRAVRLLPTYYAALAVSLLLAPFLPQSAPVTTGAILSHVFLVHNLWPAWKYAIDAPMWTMAVMAQIYFVFLLLLLPVWRRYGRSAALAVALAVGLVPRYLLPASYNLEWTYPWYVILFALGMCAADLQFGTRADHDHRARTTPWGAYTALLVLATLALRLLQRATWADVHAIHRLRIEYWGSSWPLDVVAGLASVCLLCFLSRAVQRPGASRTASLILRAVERPAAARLGAMSFSLYLSHFPIAMALAAVLNHAHVSPAYAYVGEFIIGLPLCLSVAWVLHLAVERPAGMARLKQSALAVVRLLHRQSPAALD
jgi:peptidoglycan/LPS O-acetylase OafA/YrhL